MLGLIRNFFQEVFFLVKIIITGLLLHKKQCNFSLHSTPPPEKNFSLSPCIELYFEACIVLLIFDITIKTLILWS